MCAAYMHRLYMQHQKSQNQLLCGVITEKDASVIHFSDLLCGNLKLRRRQRQTIRPLHLNGNESILTQILHDGSKNRETTIKLKEKGMTIDQPFTFNCYVCHTYLTGKHTTVYNQTCYC
jgi:hypothetical protein